MAQKTDVNITCTSERACTGCGVCYAACPAHAIAINLNSEGFLEAIVDQDKCTGCGLCKKVCSKYDRAGETGLKERLQQVGEIFGAFSNDQDIRMKCSSGGIGYEIARLCMNEGFIVCGAGYNEAKDIVEHTMAANENELGAFKGSKYIQSITGEAFSAFEADKKYIVFGTPCQIYSLHKYLMLKGTRDKFVLVDFFCHGVPSKLLWNKYAENLKSRYRLGNIENVSFRDKKTGWHNYCMHISGENGEYVKSMEDDLFYIFFLSDVCLNKPCYDCSFRRGDMHSDIRLGDFWGPRYKDNKQGVSIVIGNTVKGMEIIRKLENTAVLEKASIEDLLAAQPQAPITVPGNKQLVMSLLGSGNGLSEVYKKTLMKKHLEHKIKVTIKRLVPASLRTTLKKLRG